MIYTDGTSFKTIDLNALTSWSSLGNMPWFAEEGTPNAAYQSIAFLYRCVDLRANAVSALPWALYRGDTELASNDIDEMPEEFAYLGDLGTLLYRTEASLALTSRAYWLKVRNRVRLLGLQWLDASTMTPVWTPQGISHYERQANNTRVNLATGDVVYLWLKGLSETEPRPAPARAALNAANVLGSMDSFVKTFFDRGAIKGTLLQVEGNPPRAEMDRLKAWWKRAFAGGNKTAWEAEVVKAGVTPTVIGEGVSELGNSPLTVEKREDIATAMGVPHSLVLSNASNFATSENDRLNFYDQTVLPSAKLIQRQLNDQLFTPLGLRFEFLPDSLPVYQDDEQKKSAAFAAYVSAGIKPSIVAQMMSMDLPEGIDYEDLDPEPQPVELAQAPQDEEDAPEREEEIARFKRWAAKRKAPDVTQFKSAILSDAEKEALLGTGAAPFVLPDGPITPDAYKAMRLQLDPDDDEAESKIRDALERRAELEIYRGFEEWLDQLLREGMSVQEVLAIAGSANMPQRAKDALERALIDSVDLGVSVAIDQLGSIGFDYLMVNTAAREWARQYGGQLITRIEETTRRAINESVARWVDNGEPLGALVKDLQQMGFSRRRARLIAQTETTTAYNQANVEAYRASGVVTQEEWRTANDDRVCGICGPLDGKRAPLGGLFAGKYRPGTGAHPGCRCWTVPVVGD